MKGLTKMEENQCCCKVGKTIKMTLLTIIAVGTIVSAYYSYSANKTLNAIISGSSAAQAQPASNETITKKYAKGQTLAKAMQKDKPIVVFFYTDWCGYCKRFAPVFDKVTKSKQFKSNFNVAYVNCEDAENASLLAEYKIQGFPTVFVLDKENKIQETIDNSKLFAVDAEKELVNNFLELLKK